jgi:hypothetical protein
MSWIFTVLSLIGVVLNIYKNKYCFVIWTLTNGFWCIYDYHNGLYSQSLLFLIYFILAIWGLIKWKN